MNLIIEITKCAEIINKGEKAFTESEQIKTQVIRWYNNWGTKLECEKDVNGFWLWNPQKI